MNYRIGFKILRKWTTPVHWLFGALCGVLFVLFSPASVVLLMMFGGWEYWNDRNEMKRCGIAPQGDLDWWEAFFPFCITISVAIILHLLKIIIITWC